MGGLGDKALLSGGGEFPAVEQLIDGADELSRLVVDSRGHQALAQIARPDTGQGARDLVNRSSTQLAMQSRRQRRAERDRNHRQRGAWQCATPARRRSIGAILQGGGRSVQLKRQPREAVGAGRRRPPDAAPQESRADRRRRRPRPRTTWPPTISRTRRPGPRSLSWLRRWSIPAGVGDAGIGDDSRILQRLSQEKIWDRDAGCD